MSRPSLVEEIFLASLEKHATEERAAFLDGACRGDASLRDEVERLLQAHPSAGRFLEPAPLDAEATADFASRDEKSGVLIAGRYKLLEPIGEGGMGSVWMVQQTEPVKRTVALKLIKEGMDTRAVLARFEAERQALALMDHPNIARVLDAGSTSDGRPFFVMELVKGVPITKYCDDRRLTLRQRLELFIPVCQAVQHAHQKGVIHRDLKPSNVLVAQYDDRPVPKVIDFGVAKAAGQPLTDHTLVTSFGAVVGTPEYMSPEQAQFNQLDIDTRSDVYALGVLLYELLTGSTPFTRKEFEKAGILEILRVIREQEPPRPSTRLSTAEALPTLAANRGSEPKVLAGLLRNDLDWIVMKAMEKDRNRRYETATGFAADVQRYLSGEAVQAHPPSTAYRLKKFGRKHRVALITAMAFVGLLIATVGFSSWQAVKARRAERLAEAKAKEADENANRYWKVAAKEQKAQDKLRLSTTSLGMDLALAELRVDARVGLLKLVRTLPPNKPIMELTEAYFSVLSSKDPAERRTIELGVFPGIWDEFNQFGTMAVLAIGQQFAPLLPPLDHNTSKIIRFDLSATGRRIVTQHADGTIRLLDPFTAQKIAILRKVDEDVIEFGLSPDGVTAFTHDINGVVRLWNTDDGSFRAQTAPRPDRIKFKSTDSGAENLLKEVFRDEWFRSSNIRATSLSNDRILTWTEIRESQPGVIQESLSGPFELWDARTGGFISRLELPKAEFDSLVFTNDGRWIITKIDPLTIHVWSATDGKNIGPLIHQGPLNFPGISQEICSKQEISTKGEIMAIRLSENGKDYIHLWDTSSWKLKSIMGPIETHEIRSVNFEMLDNDSLYVEDGRARHVYRPGNMVPSAELPAHPLRIEGDLALAESGIVYETRNWRRLVPAKGQRFHQDLVRFAPDGRFVSASSFEFIDTKTEKRFGSNIFHYQPKLGWMTIEPVSVPLTPRRLPPLDHLDIDTDLLELWAKVVVRGELNDEGVFVKWNEETWEKKRQELASKPAPYADFPFPGHVAVDRLHWLRQEYGEASEADKPRIARQLLDKAETAGDAAEAARWRNVLAPKASPPVK